MSLPYRSYVAGGTGLGSIIGATQISNAWPGVRHHAVDGHEMDALEKLTLGVEGGYALFGTGTIVYGGVGALRPQVRVAAPGRIFTSADRHVGETATKLDEIFPDRVVDVNQSLPASVAGGTREVDIVMDQFIIQVKKGRAKGLAGQIQETTDTLTNNTRRVIGFAPDNFSGHAWTRAANEGIPIARNFDELIAIIRELSN